MGRIGREEERMEVMPKFIIRGEAENSEPPTEFWLDSRPNGIALMARRCGGNPFEIWEVCRVSEDGIWLANGIARSNLGFPVDSEGRIKDCTK